MKECLYSNCLQNGILNVNCDKLRDLVVGNVIRLPDKIADLTSKELQHIDLKEEPIIHVSWSNFT